MKLTPALLLGAGLMMTMTARADITFTLGNTGSLNDSNLLFNDPTDVDHVTSSPFDLVGHLNTTLAPKVTVQGNEAINAVTGGGQATITGDDGSLTYLRFVLGPPVLNPPATYTSIIFDLNAVANGTVTITGIDGTGTTFSSGALTLGKSGSNFFTTLAILGQDIREVSFTTSVDLSDVKQIRIGGNGLGTELPEPAAFILLGTIAGALGLWRKKLA